MTHIAEASNHLVISNVTIGYDGEAVVRDVNLRLGEGQIGCLLGPSGCGKSTLLRAIAGLEPLMAGEIQLGNDIVSLKSFTLAPERRGVGMVFQDIALFPHFTVAENIRFGLKGWTEKDKQKRVVELLGLVGLVEMQDRYPHELSGGQQQRIALVRAIGPKPKLLLMDEPFSGLDTSLRESLVSEVREILLQEKMSALLVTHDQMEAFAIADEIAIMNRGSLVQYGDPQEIYNQPANQFTADFIGIGGFLRGEVLADNRVKTELGVLSARQSTQLSIGHKVNVLVRPGDLVRDEGSEIKAEIITKQFRGSHFLYCIRLSSLEELYLEELTHHEYALGDHIGVKLDMGNVTMFPSNTV